MEKYSVTNIPNVRTNSPVKNSVMQMFYPNADECPSFGIYGGWTESPWIFSWVYLW